MQTWDVRLEAHEVVGPHLRYPIPAKTLTRIQAPDAPHARAEIIRLSHVEQGVPPWKPYMRQSWPQTSAGRHVNSEEEDRMDRKRGRA